MDAREYKALSENVANGDIGSFERLYEGLYRDMYLTAYYALEDETEATAAAAASIREGYSAAGGLKTEGAFKAFMMTSLCDKIKLKLSEREPEFSRSSEDSGEFDVMRFLSGFNVEERLITVLFSACGFNVGDISNYTGISTKKINETLQRVFDKIQSF